MRFAPSLAFPRGYLDDAVIRAKVHDGLIRDGLARIDDVNVSVLKGVVRLSGSVQSIADRERAVSLAAGIAGVREVQDQLQTC